MNINQLFNLSSDLICTIDIQGNFKAVNNVATMILGYSTEELLGKPFLNFVYTPDRELTSNGITAALNGKVAVGIESRFMQKNLSSLLLAWSFLWDEEQQQLYGLAKGGESTEIMERSLNESNLRYQYVSRATSDAIWDWDLQNNTLFWGDGFSTIFGYDPSELPRGINSWTNNIHPEDHLAVITSIEMVLNSQETNWKAEYRYLKADGHFAEVVDRGFIIRNTDGAAIRMVGAMHDISERKKNLKDMKRVTDDLYKRNRELHEFGYIVSHNLRSPVANIMGIASLMGLETDVPEAVSNYIRKIEVSIESLNEVITDLSKILSSTDRTDTLSLEQFELTELVNHIKVDLKATINSSRAHITVTGGPVIVHSHKAYLYSVFFNLISNALKYTASDHPQITIGFLQQHGLLEISFRDNGIGIDLKKNGSELFKPYKRFNTNYTGKGLGLFLVKSHVEALNGTIAIESELDKGTTFTISLPNSIAQL
ncbi:PAS domain-containing sensor histidine kinase [Pedobacter sp. L105]|uniref:PAS domain-containing sensor histidine kinase n=1 Tax=Pedobacter sp. L105 TaxID=1641871 RepID=UPI00131ABCD0|nr:PAS domain-containing sensor histidine kinase [Pedobacter sp. L105]